jgi:hypothetical protein
MRKPNGIADAASSEATIAARAYAIWEEQGYPEGRELDHWLQAEREILVEAPPARVRRRSAPAKAA